MHNVNKTFPKCLCSNCAFAGSYWAFRKLHCEKIWEVWNWFLPMEAWKKLENKFSWVTLLLGELGIYYARTSMVSALLGAGGRSSVFCRGIKGAVWQFFLSSPGLLTSGLINQLLLPHTSLSQSCGNVSVQLIINGGQAWNSLCCSRL